MDPRQLYSDKRLTGFCVYCGGIPETRDHVPSRVLLDEPFPQNLPVVECCADCNAGFSMDEAYLACFIECVLSGSTIPSNLKREKISRILSESTWLAKRIADSERTSDSGEQLWSPEIERVRAVLLKLARGHIAYELSLPRTEEPLSINFAPLVLLNEEVVTDFLSHINTPLWPEIGSRAFIKEIKKMTWPCSDNWQVVQQGRYQYLVSQADGDFVRILLSDYLACEVQWN
jgi:hypothetical protein